MKTSIVTQNFLISLVSQGIMRLDPDRTAGFDPCLSGFFLLRVGFKADDASAFSGDKVDFGPTAQSSRPAFDLSDAAPISTRWVPGVRLLAPGPVSTPSWEQNISQSLFVDAENLSNLQGEVKFQGVMTAQALSYLQGLDRRCGLTIVSLPLTLRMCGRTVTFRDLYGRTGLKRLNAIGHLQASVKSKLHGSPNGIVRGLKQSVEGMQGCGRPSPFELFGSVKLANLGLKVNKHNAALLVATSRQVAGCSGTR